MAKKRLSRKQMRSTVPMDDPANSNRRETVVMFVDIAGASEVSNHLSTAQYANFVLGFQDMFCEVCKKYTTRWLPDYMDSLDFNARGDEGIFMAYPNDDKAVATIIDVAICVALELKRAWLVGEWNKTKRIDQGILPVDLAVGVHVGPTYLVRRTSEVTDTPDVRPEGYAINLAKRVETNSRAGAYSRIFVSEAAHGRLTTLSDEVVYVFDEPRTIEAKGFSGGVRAFEVMHHFLPTDWSDELLGDESVRSRSGLEPPTDEELKTLMSARKLNPTNIWLAEECIRSSMLLAYDNLTDGEHEDQKKLRRAFQEAINIANYLAQGDQRDTGILMIQGLIDGECLDFKKERQRYAEARGLRKQIAVLDWYEGYSYSNEVFRDINGYNLTDDTIKKMSYDRLSASHQCLIDRAKKSLKEASENSPWSAWIKFTYGCELVQWAKNETEMERGVAEVVRAAELLDQVGEDLFEEPYLLKVRRHEKIRQFANKQPR